jgi:AraC family transcriptional activator of pobA
MKPDVIPSFFLYGEPPRSVGDRFLHIENLDDRSRASDWNIRPHAHTNLNHIFYIAQGGGEMRAEDQVLPFIGPCLLLVPARVVHGFAYETDTTGLVLTVSEPYLQELVGREPEFAPLFAAPSVAPVHDVTLVDGSFEQLGRELAWTAPGHAAAVEAVLVRFLVETLRMSRLASPEGGAAHGVQAGLVARFRELVEERYRTDCTIAAYAEALAVTPKQLRSACLKIAHASPVKIVQDRVLLEAKRLTLYSNMTVAEVGYYLGFTDPAYFSRVFSKGAGASPRAFRERGA